MDQIEIIEANVEATLVWIKEGVDKGFCSDTVCSTHSADHLREEEFGALMDGEDPCIFVLRLWDA
jgi:hypothetical protein